MSADPGIHESSRAAAQAHPANWVDAARQLVVVVAVVFAVIAGVVGTGVTGGKPINEAFSGALDSDGSFVAPARQAFAIWSVIYAGLIVFAIWQALPRQRARARQRALGWWIALTVVLNGCWVWTVQLGSLVQTVVVIAVLLVALCVAFWRVVARPVDLTQRGGWLDALLIDGVTGLHLGWVFVATVANVAGWITFIAANTWPRDPALWGAITVSLVGAVGVVLAFVTRGRIAPSLAIAWGLAWIAVARAFGEPFQMTTAIAASVTGLVVLLVPLGLKAWRVYAAEPPTS